MSYSPDINIATSGGRKRARSDDELTDEEFHTGVYDSDEDGDGTSDADVDATTSADVPQHEFDVHHRLHKNASA